MADPISALGRVISRDIATINVHATNVANSNTVGFRRQVMDMTSVAPTPALSTQGTLRTTGRALDVAVIGNGWLVESGTEGQYILTRNGHLSVSADGFLLGAGGSRIVGLEGDVEIGQATRVAIEIDGTVRADDRVAGRLFLAQPPESHQGMTPDGRILVAALPPAATDARALGGVLEYSDMDIATEMSQLMMTSRHLESTQRALQLYDRTLGTGIDQIGKE